MTLLQQIWQHYQTAPDAIAVEQLISGSGTYKQLSYRQLIVQSAALANHLTHLGISEGQKAALVCGNNPFWLVADIALQLANVIEVPLPLAFAPSQVKKLVEGAKVFITDVAGCQSLQSWQLNLTDDSHHIAINQVLANNSLELAMAEQVWQHHLAQPRDADDIVKVIHTSGTTAAPKGVQVNRRGLEVQTKALAAALDSNQGRKYLSLVPMSLLIEQLFSVQVTLYKGGTVAFLPDDVPPFIGGENKAKAYLPLIKQIKPSMIMTPPGLVEAIKTQMQCLEQQGFCGDIKTEIFGTTAAPLIACGGAPISVAVLNKLAEAGIEVFEGYGLSENTAVLSINRPGDIRIGTVGRAFDHAQIKIAADDELLIKTPSLFSGYVGQDPTALNVDEDGFLHTGDLAAIDDDGYISIKGRKKNMIITSAGRNVSPEWVESVYRQDGLINNVAVFGDERASIVGVIAPNDDGIDKSTYQQALTELGAQHLPTYAKLSDFIVLNKADVEQFFTITGRPMREKIWQQFQSNFVPND